MPPRHQNEGLAELQYAKSGNRRWSDRGSTAVDRASHMGIQSPIAACRPHFPRSVKAGIRFSEERKSVKISDDHMPASDNCENQCMKRKLVSLGIFSRPICSGLTIRNRDVLAIYRTLKDLGFKETVWQLIFDGQVAGLVLPFNSGFSEIHVRFYDDRIFAELELSRSSILHFLFPLYDANGYLRELLRNEVGNGTLAPHLYDLLVEMTSERHFRKEELRNPIWHHGTISDPYDTSLKAHMGNKLGSLVQRMLGWRYIVRISGLGFGSLALSSLGRPVMVPAFGAFEMLAAAVGATVALGVMTLVSKRFIPGIGEP